MLLRTIASAALFSTPLLLAAAPATHAQGWLNQAIQNQMAMQQYGNQAVANMYRLCITHPGACNGIANPYGTQQAIQNYQNQLSAMQQHNWNTYQRTWQSNDNWNHRAIQNCQKLWSNNGAYWSCPNGTQNTLTGR